MSRLGNWVGIGTMSEANIIKQFKETIFGDFQSDLRQMVRMPDAKKIIAKEKFPYDSRNQNSPAHYAAYHGKTECLKIIINHGGSPNCVTEDKSHKYPLLTYAIYVDDKCSAKTLLDNLQFLLVSGANASESVIDNQNSYSLAILTVALCPMPDKVKITILQLLHKYGCDFLRVDNKYDEFTGSVLRYAKTKKVGAKIVDCIKTIVAEQEQQL